MPSYSEISSPFSESWVAWSMLLMLLILAGAELFQPGRFARAFRSLPTTKERDSIFMGSGSDYRTRVLIRVYEIYILSMGLLWLHNSNYSFTNLLIASGCVTAGLAFRWVVQRWMVFNFFTSRGPEVFDRHYHYLRDTVVVLMYPMMLVALFAPTLPRVVLIVWAILLATMYVLFLLHKLVALFRINLGGLIYLPLYIITVELLPIMAMIYATQQLVDLQ